LRSALEGGFENLYPIMEKVYRMTDRHEILKERVPVEEKIVWHPEKSNAT
jgi:hypothetical protein